MTETAAHTLADSPCIAPHGASRCPISGDPVATMEHAMTDTKQPNLIREGEAAAMLGVSARTLQSWRKPPLQGPPFKRIGRSIRYSVEDIHSYMDRATEGGGQ